MLGLQAGPSHVNAASESSLKIMGQVQRARDTILLARAWVQALLMDLRSQVRSPFLSKDPADI